MINPAQSRMALYFPQRGGSGRAYLASRSEDRVEFGGEAGFERFLRTCRQSGLAAGLWDGARKAGPLATFQGADSWVAHPYKNGIALIGDAAAATDPTWGQGLSLAWRDVRELRDALVAADDDWDAAGRAYADAHDRYAEHVRTTNSWFTRIFLEPGPEADALRDHVFRQLESNPSFLPDTQVAGPDRSPPTEAHRRGIFAPLAEGRNEEAPGDVDRA